MSSAEFNDDQAKLIFVKGLSDEDRMRIVSHVVERDNEITTRPGGVHELETRLNGAMKELGLAT